MPAITDREAVNADLRKRFGSTVTRKQLCRYRDETGIYPVWIRTDAKLRIERGNYKIPPEGYSSNIPVNLTTKNAERAALAVPHLLKSDAQIAVANAVAAVEAEREADEADDDADDASETETMELPEVDASKLKSLPATARLEFIKKQASLIAIVPPKDPAFVPFGDWKMLNTVVKARKFTTILVTGLSGNGKTFGIEQSCAINNREYVIASITPETDEDDLLGGFRLVDGNTVFEVGPAVVAMLRGCPLVLDELDYASPKIACLQRMLEGKPVLLKKLGIVVTPTPGFCVFATANTKGKGDETGQFVGTNLLNEAFLERFKMTVEQQYPDIDIEKKILAKSFVKEGYTLTDHAKVFIDTLAKWANGIRKTYAEGAIEAVMSTRRLVFIVEQYGMFGANDEATEMSLNYCLSRFDSKTKDAFADFWNKIAPDPGAPINVGNLDGMDVNDPNF